MDMNKFINIDYGNIGEFRHNFIPMTVGKYNFEKLAVHSLDEMK